MSWRSQLVSEKVDIALRLAKGDCGASYGEAMLVLCAALSAMAAEVWPGIRNDRKRFAELLNDYAPSSLGATQVSVPELVSYLQKAGFVTESASIRTALLDLSPSRIVTGKDVDKTEGDIAARFPMIHTKDIRKCSYANLLYHEIRCGYSHQYRPGLRADSWPMTGDLAVPVSYINRVSDPDRYLHFHVNWVAELAITIAEAIDSDVQTIPRTLPLKWWLDGDPLNN